MYSPLLQCTHHPMRSTPSAGALPSCGVVCIVLFLFMTGIPLAEAASEDDRRLLLRAEVHTSIASADQEAFTSAQTLRAALLYEAPERTFFEGRSRVQERVDPWFSFDKVQHLTFSALFTVGWQYALENKLDWTRNDALPLSIGATAAIGLSKELYDWQLGPRRFFSYRDMIANGVGILLATGFILL